jgi:glucose/arabinose dehydrogenase
MIVCFRICLINLVLITAILYIVGCSTSPEKIEIIDLNDRIENDENDGDSDEPDEEPQPENRIIVLDNFYAELFADNLNRPTSIAFPPDATHRLFVNELNSGKIWIIENGIRIENPFFDLSAVHPESYPMSGSRGLIGLEFHPDYEVNKYVYITFSRTTANGEVASVARIKDENNTGIDFEIILPDIPSSQGHQIQNLRFGPDKMIYIGVGDAYQIEEVQNISSLHGKILRLTEDGNVPPDNPFGIDNYVYALGFRNPYDLIFTHANELVVNDNGDIGMDTFQFVQAGDNFGWPYERGNHGNSAYQEPLYVWKDVVVPVGMHVYRGTLYPVQYQNKLFQVLFGEVVPGRNQYGKRVQVVEFSENSGNVDVSFEDFAIFEFEGMSNPIDVTEGPDGKLYINDYFRGEVFRIVYLAK